MEKFGKGAEALFSRRFKWLLVLGLIMVLGFSRSQLLLAAPAGERLVIGYAGMAPPTLPLWVAVEKGFFAEEGVSVTPLFVRGSPVLLAALASGELQAGYTGGATVLSAAARGLDLQIVANMRSKLTYDIVSKPDIEKPADLRGKIFAVQAIGGTTWMSAMLAFEYFGLDSVRDNIKVIAIGDQTVTAQALESRTIDAALLDKPLSTSLKEKGLRILAELSKTDIPYAGFGLVFRRSLAGGKPEMVEKTLRALLRAMGYLFYPPNKSDVIHIMSRRLGIVNRSTAEAAYADALLTIDRKPYPSIAGLKNIQRLSARFNPDIAKVTIESLVDTAFMEDLDKSGFIDGVYRTGGRAP